MSTIRSKDYDETENRLAKDPIVIAMAEEIKVDIKMGRAQMVQFLHDESAQPRFEFMMACNDEYKSRGGTDGGHIGAIATAVLKVLSDSVN
jgi:hypothetical protein